MTERSVSVIACSVFKPELTALMERGVLPPLSLEYFDSSLHMKPEDLQNRLEEGIRKARAAGRRVLLIVGECSLDARGLIEAGVIRIPGTDCGEIFLGKQRHKELIKKGAFLLFPEWAERWKEILTRFPGLDEETSRTLVRDMHTHFAYINTGARPVPREALEACGGFFGLPVEVIESGLDVFAEAVRNALKQAAEKEPECGETALPPGRSVTAVMMLDIITGVLKKGAGVSERYQDLAQKLRELTGSRLVILAASNEEDEDLREPRILAVSPDRKANLLDSGLVKCAVRKAFETDRAEVLSDPTDEQKTEMAALGVEFCPCLVFPLFLGEKRIGAILSLGLLDTSFVDSILEIENVLSNVVAVVLRNSLLLERQDRINKALKLEVAERQRAENTLKKSEAQVRLLLDSTAEAIYGVDLKGACVFANAACLRMLGYADVARLLGLNMHDLIHHSYPDGRPMALEDCPVFRAFREGREMHRDDEVLWKADGSSFPAEYWSYPKIEDGNVTGAVVTFIDITERKRFEMQLEERRRRLNAILEGTNVGTWEWNVSTGEVVFNERWAEIIGRTLAELAPLSIETWAKFCHPEDLAKSNDILAKHFSGEFPFYDCEIRMRHRNGVWVWVHDRGKVATWTNDGKPEWMFGTHEDITGRKMIEERIRHLATHDALTGLPGLRLANERLIWSLGLARRNKNLAAVMFIDLDGFKSVNDSLGHEAGDFVLKAVARRISACVRETDTVARVGGDEFILIATALKSEADAAEIAGKIVRTVSEPVLYDGQKTAVGASIGIALFPRDSEDKDELIRKADAAMYRVKAAGKNAFGFASAEN